MQQHSSGRELVNGYRLRLRVLANLTGACGNFQSLGVENSVEKEGLFRITGKQAIAFLVDGAC
jgi:hypothetical protein